MFGISRALRTAALGFALALTVPVACYDAASLHVDVYGHGPQNVILIPGPASGTRVWYATIDELTAGDGVDDYTIYALTLPGFDGRSAIEADSLFAAIKRFLAPVR